MATERFRVTPAVYVILRRGQAVLLIRRANTGYSDGMYSLPSGHLEGNEPASVAAIRELKEEVGVTVKPADLHFVHVMHRLAESGDHERVDFGFVAEKWKGEPYIAEPHKCDNIGWFDLDKLPPNTIPMIKEILDLVDRGTYYSESNFGL